jgi:glyoxylase-like metal-dependent hydrolase (beta-lactamase superfamily II)
MEVAPGVHRLEFTVGAKLIAMYLLAGDHLILVDSGLPSTPEELYLPAIRELGRRPEEVRLLVITHADADHIGGNSAARRLFSNALIACHARDQRWCSDPAVITAERYDGFTPYGLRYDQAVFDMLASWMGPAEPMDLLLQGGERLRLAAADWLTVYHVPGHTPGHLCLYNPANRYALIADAIFGLSQVDTEGNWSAPPPYTSVDAYRGTLQTLAALEIDLLLTCHYPVMRGEAVRQFVEESRRFVDLADEVTRRLLRGADGPLTLAEAIDRADPLLGPFAFARDLQFSLLAHLDDLVAQGKAKRVTDKGITAWVQTGSAP